jgi:hypothetical protein
LAAQLAANHPDDALQYLREAINRGYKDADGLMALIWRSSAPTQTSSNSSPNSKRISGRVQPIRGSYVRLHRLLGPLLCLATRKSPSDRRK